MNNGTERTCTRFLDADGTMRRARLTWHDGEWIEFEVGDAIPPDGLGNYVTPRLPFEFHCHGLGPVDFSDFENVSLDDLDRAARAEGIRCVMAVFLPRPKVDAFGEFLQRFDRHRKANPDTHLPAVALEGPLLASVGGTPETGTWAPTSEEWEKIARWGDLGLRYTVLSPDALLPGSSMAHLVTDAHPPVEWIVETLVAHGVSPALGHFQRSDPGRSAEAVEAVVDAACRTRADVRVLTDHLFNDMPLRFRHAWRTAGDRERRESELSAAELESWTLDNLRERAGDVPGALMQGARAGRITLCMNFDREHVDPAVCRRVIELVGADAVIAMTDRTEVDRIAGHKLSRIPDNSLWYQARGVVAAGSSSIDRQMDNLRLLPVDEPDVWTICSGSAARALGMDDPDVSTPPRTCSYVGPDLVRRAVP